MLHHLWDTVYVFAFIYMHHTIEGGPESNSLLSSNSSVSDHFGPSAFNKFGFGFEWTILFTIKCQEMVEKKEKTNLISRLIYIRVFLDKKFHKYLQNTFSDNLYRTSNHFATYG